MKLTIAAIVAVSILMMPTEGTAQSNPAETITEAWSCDGEITLKSNCSPSECVGSVKIGNYPAKKTEFRVDGVDRLWGWWWDKPKHDSYDHTFVITNNPLNLISGAFGALAQSLDDESGQDGSGQLYGYIGLYYDFRGSKGNEGVEPSRFYTCVREGDRHKGKGAKETIGAGNTRDDLFAKALSRRPTAHDPNRRISISERDALIGAIRDQVAKCWSLPAGAKGAENMIIEINVAVNPDGRVREASIVNSGRMFSDPFFRAMAESALRAVKNPRCSPFKLPGDRYEVWKDLTLVFNPKEMFGG